MAKKARKHVKRAIVRLYKASSKSPVTISDSAKAEIGKMKSVLRAPDSTFLRITTESHIIDPSGESVREVEVYFDDILTRQDMVYLDNKLLFVLDSKTAVLLTGSKLRCDSLGFYLETLIGGPDGLDIKDMPQC
mgnify:FL=1